MEDYCTSTNPFLLTAIQLSTTVYVLGFTSPASILRLALLPLVVVCAFFTVLNINSHLRVSWSQPYSVIDSCLVFQYVEMAISSKWSFEAQGPSEPLATSTAEGKKTPSSVTTYKDTFYHRLRFGFNSTFSFRDVNTPHEVKNVPPFSSKDPNYVPSRAKFLLKAVAALSTCYLLMDLGESVPQPPPEVVAQFSLSRVPVFARLNSITIEDVTARITASFSGWLLSYCLVSSMPAFLSVICVSTGLTTVDTWRPMFGPLSQSYTLRGFWGTFWHQGLRKPVSYTATAITDHMLRLPRGLISRYTKVFFTFLISGFLHAIGDFTGKLPWWQYGALKCYCAQVLGIIIEDGVQAIYRKARSAKTKNEEPPVWAKVVGWVWVVGFLLFWTSPAWFFPHIVLSGPIERRLIPISVFGSLFEN